MSSLEIKRNNMWKQYSKSKEIRIRENLIVEYAYLVKYVAGRLSIYFGSNVEYEDLVSYGIFGLIDAIDKYDINKGVKFETYATLRIRGAIIDNIRDMDWVPRSVRQKSKELEKIYLELEGELGHPASDKDVAQKLGISLDRFHKLLNEVSVSAIISLDEFLEQNFEVSVGGALSTLRREDRPEDYLEIVEIKSILADSIDKLPEKERNVVSMYYFDELTLKEISLAMNVSESRISQLHTKAIIRLRGKLAKKGVMH